VRALGLRAAPWCDPLLRIADRARDEVAQSLRKWSVVNV